MTDAVDATADDARLARLAARGDRAAATALVERYQAPVRTFLRRLTPDPHLADDLTQETLIRMLRHAHHYDPNHAMKTWLLTIARRLWIDQLRKHARQGPTTSMAVEPVDQTGAPQPLDDADRRRVLDAALAQLSPLQRCAVVMFYQQQMSIEEVAAAMEMSTNTVKSHLHRARARLRELLEPRRESVMP